MDKYILRQRAESAREPQFSICYENELNPDQFQVVSALDGPILVIAGAGSGKTRTLVYRVARLIESGIAPQQILLLTFTRRSAQEMIDRAGLLLGDVCAQVRGGTFHSVANLILRQWGGSIGLGSAFTIMDRSDAEDLIHLVRNALGFGQRERRFPRKQTIAEILSKAQNTLVSVEDVIATDYPPFLDQVPEMQQLATQYAQAKRSRGLLDYDDLLARLVDLLEADTVVRERLSQSHRYIMVDEYQDTNRLQARILRLLCDGHQNLMVVGDDAQSIYSFRGAHFRNIIDFPLEFSGTRIFKLEENYRSTQPILDLTNAILAQAKERYPKSLFTRQHGGALPVLGRCETENHQSRFVCQKISEIVDLGVSLDDVAVLFRSSFHSFDLEIELTRSGIPFIKRGGSRFVESGHIKDVLAHLRVAQNPFDQVSWNRVLQLLDGIGPKKSESILRRVLESCNPIEAIAAISKERAGAVLAPTARLLSELHAETTGVASRLELLLEHYLPILRERFDDHPKRAKDLEHLYTISHRYHRLDEFLADMALEPPDGNTSESGASAVDGGRIVLSTIHSAKGLEWHTVFVIWALDGRFPSVYSLETEDELEEERRLLYVATTRAKQNLFVTYPINVFDRTIGTVLSRPSRFLENLSPQLFLSWDIVEAVDSPSEYYS